MSETDIVETLTRHYRADIGLTHGSPDRCACGAKTLPEPGEEDVMVRRARAFARHIKDVLASDKSEDADESVWDPESKKLRRAAKVLRAKAEDAASVWGVEVWRPSLSELSDVGHRDEYRRLPAWMQNHVATDDVHGSVIVTSPWQDTGPVTYIAAMHPGVGLDLADWLDEAAALGEARDVHFYPLPALLLADKILRSARRA